MDLAKWCTMPPSLPVISSGGDRDLSLSYADGGTEPGQGDKIVIKDIRFSKNPIPFWRPHDGLHDACDLRQRERPEVGGVAVAGGRCVARQPDVVLGDEDCTLGVAGARLFPGPGLGLDCAASESFDSLKNARQSVFYRYHVTILSDSKP